MTSPNTKAAVGVTTQTGTNSYGDPVYSSIWALYDGIWWPEGSREVVGGQDQVTWHNTICLPTGTTVESDAKVIPAVKVDDSGSVLYEENGTTPQGDQYDVDGEPVDWPSNGSGWRHPYSTVVNLKRTTN